MESEYLECTTEACRTEVYNRYLDISAEQQHALAMCGTDLACQAPHLQAMMAAQDHHFWQFLMVPRFTTDPIAELELQAHQAYLGFEYEGTTVTPDLAGTYARYPEWAAENCQSRSGAECMAGFQGEVRRSALLQGIGLGAEAFATSATIAVGGGAVTVVGTRAVAAARACAANPACWAEMSVLAGEATLGVTGATAGQTFFTVGAAGTAVAGQLVLRHGDEIVGVVDDLGRVFTPVSQQVDDAGRFLVQSGDGTVGYFDDAGQFAAVIASDDIAPVVGSGGATNSGFATADEAFEVIGDVRAARTITDARGGTGTVSVTEVDGQRFVGVNSTNYSDADRALAQQWEQTLGIPAGQAGNFDRQMLYHAEANTLMQIYQSRGGQMPSNLTLYVDRIACSSCQNNLPNLVDAMGMSEVRIVLPDGRSAIITPNEFLPSWR